MPPTNYSIVKPFSGATTKAKDRRRKKRRPSVFGPLLTGEAGKPASQKKPGFGQPNFGKLAKGSSEGVKRATADTIFGKTKAAPLLPQPSRPVVRDTFGQPAGQTTVGGLAQNPAQTTPQASPNYVVDEPNPFDTEKPSNWFPAGYAQWLAIQQAMPTVPINTPVNPNPPDSNEGIQYAPLPTAPTGTTGAGGTAAGGKWPGAGAELQPWEVGDIGRWGHYWLARLMRDPYALSDAGLRQSNEQANLAFQTAANRMLSDQFASGAARSGVAAGERGNMELARGAEMARINREWEQFRQQLGDARLQQLLLPYLQMALQQRAINAGLTPPPSSSTMDWLGPLLQFGGTALLDWLRSRYSSSSSSSNSGSGSGGGYSSNDFWSWWNNRQLQ